MELGRKKETWDLRLARPIWNLFIKNVKNVPSIENSKNSHCFVARQCFHRAPTAQD